MTKQELKQKSLSSEEAKKRQNLYGKNELSFKKKPGFCRKVLSIVQEPMFLLLLITSVVYFVLGEVQDGLIMLFFVLVMITIECIQEWKTEKTLDSLKKLSSPQAKVLRDGIELEISSIDLVVGDILLVQEGTKVPADGKVLLQNDLRVDESTLTGETALVWKTTKEKEDDYFRQDRLYAGTLVVGGSGYIEITAIGVNTEYGKISQDLDTIVEAKTPLERQVKKLIRMCGLIAFGFFLFVVLATFLNLSDLDWKTRWIKSILAGITLAMAMIPEEFPVVLTVFLSMGAWRLAKRQALVRKLSTIETLGAISTLCVDKTGTLTMNQMRVNTIESPLAPQDFWYIAAKACEEDPYDPMEKAILQEARNHEITKDDLEKTPIVKEYPFTSESKRMGHGFEKDGKKWIVSKGSIEKILEITSFEKEQQREVECQAAKYSKQGYRVIGVARKIGADYVASLSEGGFEYCGLIALQDPPRPTLKNDMRQCQKAGIRVVMITGDAPETAHAIAEEIDMPHCERILTGEDLSHMSDQELAECVLEVQIYSRVIPEQKLRIVKALQKCGQLVAMTGDGVNDATALKQANVGIAMGKHGSEVSREAADLILLDDNFKTILDTVSDGRRIYENIKEAVAYILIIHMPIALSALMGPLLRIPTDQLLLLPVHVMLLELMIDPTCSLVLERRPSKKGNMNRPPRRIDDSLLSKKGLLLALLQGFCLFLGAYLPYLFYLQQGKIALARTVGLAVILLSNFFLVQISRSDQERFWDTFQNWKKDRILWFVSGIILLTLFLFIYTPLRHLFSLAPLSFIQILFVFSMSIASTLWYEVWKWIRRSKQAK